MNAEHRPCYGEPGARLAELSARGQLAGGALEMGGAPGELSHHLVAGKGAVCRLAANPQTPAPTGPVVAAGSAVGEQAAANWQLTAISPNNTNINQTGADSERRYRPQKYCAVCGDKAIACNFNAVTCESCKAFFRRNAFKEGRLKCLFESRCIIDRVTRRFCSKCRLLKCFQIGMKREWILTDEQKQSKRVKIMQNKQFRLERARSSSPQHADHSDDSLSAVAGAGPGSAPGSAGSVAPPSERPATSGARPSARLVDGASQTELYLTGHLCTLAAHCHFCAARALAPAAHSLSLPAGLGSYEAPPAVGVRAGYEELGAPACCYVESAPGLGCAPPPGAQFAATPDAQLASMHLTPAPAQLHQQQQQPPLDMHTGAGHLTPLQVMGAAPMLAQAGLPAAAHYGQSALAAAQYAAAARQPAAGAPPLESEPAPVTVQVSPTGSNRSSGLGSELGSEPQQMCVVKVEGEHSPERAPLSCAAGSPEGDKPCSAARRAGETEISRADAHQPAGRDQTETKISISKTNTSANNNSNNSNNGGGNRGARPRSPLSPLSALMSASPESSPQDHQQLPATAPDAQEAHLLQACVTAGEPHNNTNNSNSNNKFAYVMWNDELFLEPASTEAALRERLARLDFCDSERQLIMETIDATRFLFEVSGTYNHKMQNTLNDFVVICDLSLRRLIKTVKQIKAFRMLSMDDQIVMLKTACFKILLLRSAFHYHDESGGWLDIKTGKVLHLSILKSAKKSLVYDKHLELVKTIPDPLRKDRMIMAILSLATLFDRNNELKHTNSVSLDNLIYLSLLRKYLIHTQPDPLTKYEYLVTALQATRACSDEYNVFFSKDFEPQQMTPLLLEIFDISVN